MKKLIFFRWRNAIKIPFFSSSKTNRRETKKSRRRLKLETFKKGRRKRKSFCFMTAGNIGEHIVKSWSLFGYSPMLNMPKYKEPHHPATAPRLFTREQNEYISESMKKEPLYNFLTNVAAPFCTVRTGGLYMHPAEVFVNGAMLTDDIRGNTGSARTPIISLVNNGVNEIIWATAPNTGTGLAYRAFTTTDISTGQETPIVKNIRVLIGTQSILTLEHSGIEEYSPAIEQLRNYCMEQNEELTTESLKISRCTEFKAMKDILHHEAREYVTSGEYVRPYLLRKEETGREDEERAETRRKLKEILDADNPGLSEEDEKELLRCICLLVETGAVVRPSREIKTNATQKKIYHILHMMYKQTNTEKKLWLELIKNCFPSKFDKTSDDTLRSNFHQ